MFQVVKFMVEVFHLLIPSALYTVDFWLNWLLMFLCLSINSSIVLLKFMRACSMGEDCYGGCVLVTYDGWLLFLHTKFGWFLYPRL